MLQFLFGKPSMPDAKTALPGRDEPVFTGATHHVNGRSITAAVPRRASRSPTSPWAASGAPRRSSGRSPACG